VIGGRGVDSPSSGQKQMADHCAHGKGPSGFLNFGEFLDYLRNYRPCKKDSVTGVRDIWFVSYHRYRKWWGCIELSVILVTGPSVGTEQCPFINRRFYQIAKSSY
jgi:hypothetical protein